jgi:hypothetical protein
MIFMVRPKDLLDRLAPLLPETHSPIQAATGNGNQKAYLAEVAVVELVLEVAHLRLADLRDVKPGYSASDFAAALDDQVEAGIRHDKSLDETTREQLTLARRGQGVFRRSVLEVEPVCRVTGIKKGSQARAMACGHIVQSVQPDHPRDRAPANPRLPVG